MTSAMFVPDVRTPCADPRARGAFFHPDGERGPARAAREAAARALCAACPVADACRAFALEHRIAYGTWGGSTETSRRTAGADPAPVVEPGRMCGKGIHDLREHGSVRRRADRVELHCRTCANTRSRESGRRTCARGHPLNHEAERVAFTTPAGGRVTRCRRCLDLGLYSPANLARLTPVDERG